MQTNFKQFGTILSREEAKKIRGGSKCLASTTPTGGMHRCSTTEAEAEAHAGEGGWWCCNCEEALVFC